MKTGPWKCDTCGQLIKNSKEGWLEWLYKEDKMYGLRLVHQYHFSPLKNYGGCYYDQNQEYDLRKTFTADNHLDVYLGSEGLINFFESFEGYKVDEKELIEMIKRLHVPGYEENFRRPFRHEFLKRIQIIELLRSIKFN